MKIAIAPTMRPVRRFLRASRRSTGGRFYQRRASRTMAPNSSAR